MKYSEHCYAVTGLAFIPPWAVNSGFVTGKKSTLIVDSSASLLSAQTVWGYALAVRPQNTLIVVNTEQHFDHTGGNSFFREKGIDIYGHFKINRQERDLLTTIDDYNQTIPDSIRKERHEGEILFQGTQFANPNQLIFGDMELDLGEISAQILLTPGHTPTNISVYIPSDRVLFCGDCLVNGYFPNLTEGACGDWQQWKNSLERILHLNPEIIIPGHGAVISQNDIEKQIHQIHDILQQAIEEKKFD